jgi:hypothetical protein
VTDATTLDLDRRTIYSARLLLAGKPERLVRDGELVKLEECKSALRVFNPHRVQLAVYFLLAEEEYGVRPQQGFIMTGDGTRHQMANSDTPAKRPARTAASSASGWARPGLRAHSTTEVSSACGKTSRGRNGPGRGNAPPDRCNFAAIIAHVAPTRLQS